MSTDTKMADLILLTGFLGAGKTTLLNKILSWQGDLSRTVVIVNEFGALGIDGLIVQNAGSEVIELASGCICCSLKIDLSVLLKRIRQQYQPERILIESTGVADPVGLFEVFEASELCQWLRLNKVITVLDADLWDARECFGAVFFSQLRKADLILLNKIDMVAEDSIGTILEEIHQLIPDSQVIPTVHCNVNPEILWAARSSGEADKIPAGLNGPAHRHGDAPAGIVQFESEGTAAFTSFSFENPGIMDEACFERFIAEMPWELFRMKGLVRFERRSMLVNCVGGKCTWSDWPEPAATRLAFVGWKVDGNEMTRKLERCLVDH